MHLNFKSDSEIEISDSEKGSASCNIRKSYSENEQLAVSIDSLQRSLKNDNENDEFISKIKDSTINRLHAELEAAQRELHQKHQECSRLSGMQQTVDKEIHELTASLFQEAHKMVTDANVKRVFAEKLLKEANGKIEVLQAELAMLKSVICSQTSNKLPNPLRFCSPQKSVSNQLVEPTGRKLSAAGALFGHRRNLSDESAEGANQLKEQEQIIKDLQFSEVDAIYHREFVSWREHFDIENKKHPFLLRIYDQDILPCLNFQNTKLADAVLQSIEENRIVVEQLIVNSNTISRDCALCDVPRICNFRINLNCDTTSPEWHYISQLSRNRIASVCDFFTYLRYLNQGLVKCGVLEAYWEIIRLRKNMCLARLGLGFVSSNQVHMQPHQRSCLLFV